MTTLILSLSFHLAAHLANQPVGGLHADPGAIQVVRVGFNDAIRPVAFASAPNGSQIAVSAEDGTVRIMDAKTMQTVHAMTKHLQPAYGLAWSSDGKIIASGDETARIFLETSGGRKMREYRTHTRGIQKLSFNQSNTQVLSTGKDDVMKLYDIQSPSAKDSHQLLGQGANFYGGTFSPHANLFCCGVLAEGSRLYDGSSRQMRFDLKGHEGQGVLDVAFNPGGTRLVSAGKDGTAILWEVNSGKKIGTIRGHTDWVTTVAFSPNAQIIATSSTDGTVRLWNAGTLQQVGSLQNQFAVGSPLCFTADGTTLVTVADSGAIQFNRLTPPQGAAPAPKKVKAVRSRQ